MVNLAEIFGVYGAGPGPGRPSAAGSGGAGATGAAAPAGGARARLRIVSRCASEDEFLFVFSHLYEADSLLFFTEERRQLGAPVEVEVTLRDGRPVLAGRGEVLESLPAAEGPLGKAAMRILFVSIDAGALPIWNRLRRLASRTVRMWRLAEERPAAPSPAGTRAMWRLERLRRTEELARLTREPEAGARERGDAVPTPQWSLLQDMDAWIEEAERLRGEGRKTDTIPNLKRSGEIEAPGPEELAARWLTGPVEALVACDVEALEREVREEAAERAETLRRPAERAHPTALIRSLPEVPIPLLSVAITAISIFVTIGAIAYLLFG